MEYNVGRRTYLLLILGVVLVFIGCIMCIVLADRDAPVITVSEAALPSVYTDDMDISELLNGVTAYDDQDGDVTGTLIIEKMIVLSDSQHVKVVYAASDQHDNISKKSVLVPYSGVRNFIDVSPEDDTSKGEEETPPEETTSPEEQPVVNDPVYQEGGSGTPVLINQEEADSTGIPQIELKYTDYTIHAGQPFSTDEALEMVSATYDDKDTVSNRIVINNMESIDVNTVGDYVLNYSVSDKEGNKSEVQSLTLHVIE